MWRTETFSSLPCLIKDTDSEVFVISRTSYRMTKHPLALDPTINSQVTVIVLVVVVSLATILQACTSVVST